MTIVYKIFNSTVVKWKIEEIDARKKCWEKGGKKLKKKNKTLILTVSRVFFHEESFLRRWSDRPAQRKRVTPKNTRGTQAGRCRKVVRSRDGIWKEEKGEKTDKRNCTRDGDLVFKSLGEGRGGEGRGGARPPLFSFFFSCTGLLRLS